MSYSSDERTSSDDMHLISKVTFTLVPSAGDGSEYLRRAERYQTNTDNEQYAMHPKAAANGVCPHLLKSLVLTPVMVDDRVTVTVVLVPSTQRMNDTSSDRRCVWFPHVQESEDRA